LLEQGGVEEESLAAELLVIAGEDKRAAELLLRLARRDLARGALRSAMALLERVPQVSGCRATAVAGERVWLLTQLGQSSSALEEGERALDSATGAGHAELCLRLAQTAVRARQWDRAVRYVIRAGRPDDPRTPLLAAGAAFGTADVERAGVLAADAVGSAERAGAVQPLCEALELLGRCAMQAGEYQAAEGMLRRAASIAAEHGLVAQQVEAELKLAMLAERMGSARPELLLAPRELAVRAGMLAEVARIDLRRANVAWLVEGPSAAEPLARASAELAGVLRLTPLQAVVESMVAGILAAVGDEAGMRRFAATASARANRPPEVELR
jgi:tetratricopeptide (TPR) repeat protein